MWIIVCVDNCENTYHFFRAGPDVIVSVSLSSPVFG